MDKHPPALPETSNVPVGKRLVLNALLPFELFAFGMKRASLALTTTISFDGAQTG